VESERRSALAARARELLLAAGVFLLATVLLTWPQAARLGTGLGDLWDAKLNAWIFHWDYHQTFRAPLDLFQANTFYPAKYALAFSENLWGAAVFGFPLFAAGASTTAVYNFLFLLGMFLSALGAWALARYVTGNAAASLLAGFVYAFVPWRLSQIPHVQFQWGPFLPLLLLFLLRWLDGGRRRDVVLFGVFFAWNALTNVHYALFSGFLLAVVLAWEVLTIGWRPLAPRVRASLLAVAVAGVAVLPFYVPYPKVARLYGMRRSLGEMKFYSARPSAFLVPGGQNKLWAPLTQRFGRPEGELFPGVLPVALAVYALVALKARRREEVAPESGVSVRRRRAARVFDVLAVAAFAAGIASLLIPGLRVGPLSLSDPRRLLVFLTLFLLIRLLLAFPARSRYSDLADFLRQRRLDRRGGLFLAVGLAGMIVALGAYTPYYTFLFKSFGFLFRAIRVPARGVVLLHVALGVLAAWGLALLLRRVRRRGERAAFIAAALVLTAIEYRAAPIDFHTVDPVPAPVYRWLGPVAIPGAVLELPIGFDYDAEHVFRSPAHWQRLVNGYSGFAPRHYDEVKNLFEESPVPDRAWERVRALGTALLLFHPHEIEGLARLNYSSSVRRALTAGALETVGSFAHGSDRDFVFRVLPAPPFETGIAPAERDRAAAEFRRLTSVAESELAPPFGVIDFPVEDAEVSAGAWGYGWALDDSGVAEVRVATELGPATPAVVGGTRPDIPSAYPGYVDAARSGFGFLVPNVAPGPHTLSLTIVGRDGGERVLTRRVRIR
jgi:hypothetical protein